MNYLRTPVDALERAMAIGGHAGVISSRRRKKYQGRPGEVIERMDEPTRALLRELRSDDISPERASRYAAWLGEDDSADGRWPAECQRMMLDFDQKVLGLTPFRGRAPTPNPWT